MYKKDFTEWQLSKGFDMEKLRNLFNQSLPEFMVILMMMDILLFTK
ncbi:hypothetical protein [Lactococcus allomyrinae]|nr:hypothetical protein [Lactococcus allomyrinae]